MNSLVREECARSNPLVSLSGKVLQSSGAPSVSTHLLPVQLTLDEQLTEEYLNDIADSTPLPSTFDVTELKNQLLKIGNDQCCKGPFNSCQRYGYGESVHDHQISPCPECGGEWHNELSAASTSKLAAKWCEEFNNLISNTRMETIWETVVPSDEKSISSSLWPAEFLSEFEYAVKHERISADDLASEFLYEITASDIEAEDFVTGLVDEFTDLKNIKFDSELHTTFYDKYQFSKNNCFTGKDVKIENSLELIGQGRLSNAILYLEAIVQKDCKNSKAWYLLGLCQAENENDRLAICAFKRSVDLDPSNGNVYLALAVSLTNESLNHVALEQLNYWIHSHPTYRVFLQQYTQPLVGNVSLDNDFFAKVEKKFLYVVRRKATQNDVDLQNALGILYSIGGNYERASEAFKIAVSISKNDPRLWNRLGAVLNNSGRSAEAVGAFRRALELFPHYVRAKYNLGIACMRIKSYSEAVGCFLDALSLQENIDNVGSSTIFSTLRAAVLSLYPENASDILSAIYNRDIERLKMIL